MKLETPEIPLSSIELGSRYRDDYGDIPQLIHSIKKNGLITPIAVGVADKINIPRTTDLPYILLAGGRRIKALTEMGWTMIPVRIYDQPISILDLRSIELAENFDRKEMTYPEQLALMKEIDDLQMAIHGPKIARSANASGWSQADTAKLLKKSPASVTIDLQLARAIEDHPELQLDKCKNKAEALKRLKNVTKIVTNSLQAQTYTKSVNGTGSSDQLFRKLCSNYIIADCRDVMKGMPSNSLNFIEIDPPYAIDLPSVKSDNECIGYNEVKVKDYAPLMTHVLRESYRLLKDGSWMIVWFAADPWFQPMSEWIRDVGFKMNLLPGIWTKPQGQTAQPETYLGNSYEMFFYARKGKARLQKPGRSNIFDFKPVNPTLKYHPTQRPLDLMKEVYSTFASPNSNGYIPFLGSGVGLLTAHDLSMNMIGTDLTQTFKDGYILEIKKLTGAN